MTPFQQRFETLLTNIEQVCTGIEQALASDSHITPEEQVTLQLWPGEVDKIKQRMRNDKTLTPAPGQDQRLRNVTRRVIAINRKRK